MSVVENLVAGCENPRLDGRESLLPQDGTPGSPVAMGADPVGRWGYLPEDRVQGPAFAGTYAGCTLAAHRHECIVAAMRHVQMRNDAPANPEPTFEESDETIQVLAASIRKPAASFAILGGFLGRKCDLQPSWLTIARGWYELQVTRPLKSLRPLYLARIEVALVAIRRAVAN